MPEIYPVTKESLCDVGTRGWIPVNERLPENDTNVLLWCESYCCVGYYIERFTVEAPYDYEGSDEYNEEDDTYYVEEGWYERIYNWGDFSSVWIADRVIAWMPLPEPYKG